MVMAGAGAPLIIEMCQSCNQIVKAKLVKGLYEDGYKCMECGELVYGGAKAPKNEQTVIRPHGKAVREIMKQFGIPNHCKSFTIHAECDSIVSVTCTYYATTDMAECITKRFQLVGIKDEQSPDIHTIEDGFQEISRESIAQGS